VVASTQNWKVVDLAAMSESGESGSDMDQAAEASFESASPEEIEEYARFIGVDPKNEPELLWIAKEGVSAPVPSPWKTVTEGNEETYYYNTDTGKSMWDHPLDEHYKKLVIQHRGGRGTMSDTDEESYSEDLVDEELEGSRGLSCTEGEAKEKHMSPTSTPKSADTDAARSCPESKELDQNFSPPQSPVGAGVDVDDSDQISDPPSPRTPESPGTPAGHRDCVAPAAAVMEAKNTGGRHAKCVQSKPKSWTELNSELQQLTTLFDEIKGVRAKQQNCLRILKSGA